MVLISGRGSNLQAIIEDASDSDCPFELAAVISNRPDAAGLARAWRAHLSGSGSISSSWLATNILPPYGLPKLSRGPR